MATQLLDTELDVARKNLHFFQRELYRERFTIRYTLNSELMISVILKRIKYWRTRYNAAMAIEQEREQELKDTDLSIAIDQLRY